MMLAVAAVLTASAIDVTPDNNRVTQNFDSMYDGTSATLAMPEGWRVERNLSAPRNVGAWSAASAEVMYSGGVSLASNAKNGTYNFGNNTTPADRAVGGLTTSVDGGTRGVNVMTRIVNAGDADIETITFNYDIEKYRNGDNSAGFDVQVYYSTDGTNWATAGDDLKTHFAPDAATAGAAEVPISVTAVSNKTIRLKVAAGKELYLAWNISVATGATCNKAPGLSVDNIDLAFGYASGESGFSLYAEDVTGWNNLYLDLGNGTTLSPAGSANVNGVAYKYFELPAGAATYNIAFNNGGSKSVAGPAITANRDYYLCVTAKEVTEIADPDTYTGWVDPDRKPFVASGIYLRGEVNSWGAQADWEFSDEGDGIYVLYDKTLNGAFKVADASWSSACNYGSNGSAIAMDAPYALVSGTNDNISCGVNTYACKRIVLTLADGNATLLLESNTDDTNLNAVYIIGDFNGWDYMDESGKLEVGDTEEEFAGQVTFTAGADGLCHWRLYQRLGMSGVWGNPGGDDATGDNTSGTLEKGSNGRMTTAAGTYKVTFNITTGQFAMEKLGSVPTTMALEPANVVLVPQLPEQVKVLSLNNSLIHYNNQDFMFNDIAAAMGKNATWKKHSLLGKSLATHWNEGDGLAGDGLPGAKMLVRTEAWSHIILQEQSSLPRTDVATFRANVKRWVDYIREYCPNPNAVIILPVNWAYSGDWDNFTNFNNIFLDNYKAVARELGVTLCPVGVAYQNCYDAEGAEGLASWFQDDRHPTDKSTYLAACMEYQLIFGEDATSITWAPAAVSAADAEAMRGYAAATMNSFVNYVDHTAGKVRFALNVYDQFGMPIEPAEEIVTSLSGGGTIDDNAVFTTDGTEGEFTLNATCGNFAESATIKVAHAETEVVVLPSIKMNNTALSVAEDFNSIGADATATLPEGWRIDRQTTAPRTVGRFDQADEHTMYSGGTSLASNAKNGTWNLGATADATDRALGGITTGVAGGTRAVNVYAHLLNDGSKNIENVTLTYDIEKYRQGNNAAGFAVQLYYSIDGRNWTSAGSDFYTKFDADSQTAGYADAPGDSRNVSAKLPVNLEPMVDLFLAWNISVDSGDNAAGAQVLAIDNVTLSGSLPTIPAAKHYIFAEDKTGWDALGLYAWGDSELFGAWPGEAVVGDSIVGGVNYKVFLLDTEGGNYHLIFNNWNNGSQLPDYDIVANRDYYFRLENGVATEVVPLIYSEFDINMDGNVNVGDVAAIYAVILGGTDNADRADVNGDGTVNAGDVSSLYEAILAQ